MKQLSIILILIPQFVLGGMDIWGKGEVPSITDPKYVPRTLNEIWDAYEKDYDKNNPLEPVIHKTWETEDGIVVSWAQVTVGTFRGKKATICGYYAYPKGAKSLPAVVAFTGGGQGAVGGIAEEWARLGYVGFHPHNSGSPMKDEKLAGLPTTDWGVIKHKGGLGPYGKLEPITDNGIHNTIDDVFSPRNTFYFPRQISSRRIITFLAQQPQVNPKAIGVTGHSTGGGLATHVSIDPRIAAAVPSMGGAGGLFLPHPHLTGNTRNQGNHSGDKLELVKNTIDGYAYYQKMHAPILVVGASNDFNAPDFNCVESLKLAKVPQKHYATWPNLNHRTQPEVALSGYLWFEDHLKGTFDFREAPQSRLLLKQKDGVPVFVTAAPKTKLKLKRVDVCYVNDGDVKNRVWTTVTPDQGDAGTWSIRTPVSDLDKPLFAFANFIYEIDPIKAPGSRRFNGKTDFVVTSHYAYVWPEALKAAGVKASAE